MRALNPIAVAAVISAGMKVLVLAGVDLSTELQLAILTFGDALLALYVQSQTTNVQQMKDAGTSRTEVQIASRPDNDVQLHPVCDGRLLQQWERPRD